MSFQGVHFLSYFILVYAAIVLANQDLQVFQDLQDSGDFQDILRRYEFIENFKNHIYNVFELIPKIESRIYNLEQEDLDLTAIKRFQKLTVDYESEEDFDPWGGK